MLLPFEMSSDLSEEARLCDEIRNVGLKDEGRLTYAEMLMAFRRSQRSRPSLSRDSSSRGSSVDYDSDDHNIIDYLPPQTHPNTHQHHHQQHQHQQQQHHQHHHHNRATSATSAISESVNEHESNRSEQNVYIRLASLEEQKERKNGPGSKRNRILLKNRNYRNVAQPRPLYSQADFGPINAQATPRAYRSFPNYPRYRQPRRPPPRPNWNLYFILAFLLLGLMIISFLPLIF